MRMKQVGALVALAMIAVSCGGTATVSETPAQPADPPAVSQVEPTAPPPTVEPAPEPTESTAPPPTAEPAPEPTAASEPEPTPIPESAGAGGWATPFQVGSCFNASAADPFVAGPPIDCEAEHENEIFLLTEVSDGPDDPYPVTNQFVDELFETVCDPATAQFGGADWDQLPFRTAVFTPSEDQWAAGDRAIACTAQSALGSRPMKIGTAAGSGLTSDAGIVARSSVADQTDFFFSFQRSTLYPLTSGRFNLPPDSPQVTTSGFQFAASEEGEAGAEAWTFLFDELEVAGLETGLAESWEVASVHFVSELPAFMFAARETEDDDWDIYLTSGGETTALTDSPADDRWPSLSPAEDLILWSSGGNIWRMDIDGTNKVQLTDGPGNAFETQMSPNGTQVVYTSDQSGNEDVWIMNVDGSDQSNLTNHPSADSWPFFDNTGTQVFFQTDRLGVNAVLMLMELDGSDTSYFSFEFLTNAALLPDSVTERFKNELTPLTDLSENGGDGVDDAVVTAPGSADDRVAVEHSSGRFNALVPGGWEYTERRSDGVASLLTAPSIDDFNERWDAFGVTFTLVEAAGVDGMIAVMDDLAPARDRTCTVDSNSTEVDGSITTVSRTYSCGERGRVLVTGEFRNNEGVGMIFEGQWSEGAENEAFIEGLNSTGFS